MKLRILLLTPYSPIRRHDHAAADLASPFMSRLAKYVDLHVYASDGDDAGVHELPGGGSVTMHPAAPTRRHVGLAAHFGSYPRMLRGGWQYADTLRVRSLADTIQPDVVHAEYVQPGEVMVGRARIRGATSMTLHDITQSVAKARTGRKSPRALLRWLDYLRIRRLERRVLESVSHVFVFSERDRQFLDQMPARVRAKVSVVALGVEPPRGAGGWNPPAAPHALFAGAMWRDANQATAAFLIEEVMPLVWRTMPEVRLRIVGARPPDNIFALARDERIEVVGEVPDLDDEYVRATLNLAPSMIPAGILLKSLRAMIAGCPVVLNSMSAQPIKGLVAGRHALVADGPEAMSAAIVELVSDPLQGRRIGKSGAELIAEHYSWDACVHSYVEVFRAMNAQFD